MKKRLRNRNPVHEGARKPRRQAKRNTLSFEVVEIRKVWLGYHLGTIVNDTVLRDYVRNQQLVIRGTPWPIGAKVDFAEIKCEPYRNRGLSPRKKNSHGVSVALSKLRSGQSRTRKGHRGKVSR